MRAPAGGRGPRLIDRDSERAVLDRFVVGVRAGEGQALVVLGEPGMGKTVLLDYLAGRAGGCRVARAAGVQSEMELAFAGLHQLCGPMMDHAGRLPGPQQEALRTVFGLSAGPPPDRFMVGLAVLSLLSEAAGERPLVCVVDDQQWLDQASAQTLSFAARRLGADPVGLVFATRDPGPELAGLVELPVGRLRERDARALLDSALTGPLDARVRELIVAETGEPAGAAGAATGLTQAELAGGFGLLGTMPLTGQIEDSFRRQLAALPADTRRLLALAAADPSGNRSLMWQAAGRLGIPVQAGQPAQEAGLVDFGVQVRFRHPLARPADLLLDGLALVVTDGLAAAAPVLRQAAVAFPGPDAPVEERLRWSLLSAAPSNYLWDVDGWLAVSTRTVQLTRQVGALDYLPLHLQTQATAVTCCGDFPAAAAMITEARDRAAEDQYREAVDRLGRTRLRPELARTYLLYGEWLCAENRRADAREPLRAAHDLLSDIGMEAFAERARRELLAVGVTVRGKTSRPAGTVSPLTPQEEQIGRLAADGHSNPEIGAQLFLSARTVEFHLHKVYAKLGISSRRELHTALATLNEASPSA